MPTPIRDTERVAIGQCVSKVRPSTISQHTTDERSAQPAWGPTRAWSTCRDSAEARANPQRHMIRAECDRGDLRSVNAIPWSCDPRKPPVFTAVAAVIDPAKLPRDVDSPGRRWIEGNELDAGLVDVGVWKAGESLPALSRIDAAIQTTALWPADLLSRREIDRLCIGRGDGHVRDGETAGQTMPGRSSIAAAKEGIRRSKENISLADRGVKATRGTRGNVAPPPGPLAIAHVEVPIIRRYIDATGLRG